ncbi:LLM class flavin-dependent oxidoreductase [Streptomyces sp. NPDC088921]|uniref:LLM class flavin-dependent oxidoreductase n=1 Tax=unclassified Streptomyces TaxID=2593676 RepID=UPI0034340C83
MTSERPRFRLGFLTHVQGRDDDIARTYRNAQELFVVADELGFDVGWVAQHHVPLGGGGLSSPWTFLAHAAARTTRIRLGTAITVLPLEDPVRLSEDIAVVDTLSGGRVEFGAGSGSNGLEYAAFGKDRARRRELTSENPTPARRLHRPCLARGVQRAGSRLRRTQRFEPAPEPGGLRRRRPHRRSPTPLGRRYLAAWDRPHRPRIGLSRFVFPAKDRRTALAAIGDDVHRAALRMAEHGAFPRDFGRGRGVAPLPLVLRPSRGRRRGARAGEGAAVATDLITQCNPAVPDHDAAIRALELIATEVAPALGWKPAQAAEPASAGV